MPTQNVISTQSGTGWTVDVTNANLLSDTTVKDFIVLHNSVAVPNTTYTKTTPTILTYTGTSLAANTSVEIRRKTPSSQVQPVIYGSKLSSSLWNSELDRTVRWKEEADLNGVGAAFSGVIPTPQNSAYPTGWSTDVVYSPTRQALYNVLSTLAPLNSAALTGTPTLNGNALTTTTAVNTLLASYAPLSSPALTGTPTVGGSPIATNASIASFGFSSPTATTQALYDSSSKVATDNFVVNSNRPAFKMVVTATSASKTALTTIVFNSTDFDTDSACNVASGSFTVPVGAGGKFFLGSAIIITNTSGANQPNAYTSYLVNGTVKAYISFSQLPASPNNLIQSVGNTILALNAGDVVTMQVNCGSGATFTYGTVSGIQNYLFGYRLCA